MVSRMQPVLDGWQGTQIATVEDINRAGSVQSLVAVQLFGSVAVHELGRTLGPRDFGGSRPKQVLEILLASRGHWVPAERLADLLWGEQLPENPAASLHTFVSVLRRHLSGDRDRSRQLVVTEPDGYRFGVEHAVIDLDRFDELLDEAGRAPSEVALSRLREALSLARGEVLEDEPYSDWAETLRGTYRSRVLGANLEAADAALAGRDYPAGLNYAQSALALDRFSERAQRLQMLALYAMDRAHEALECFSRFRALLDRELGLEPGADSRALQERILRQDDLATMLPRASGEIRLRADKPWLLFLGRREELSDLLEVFERAAAGRFSVALIDGEAGIGKSRLLDEFAATLEGVRVGRAVCIDLEGHLPYVPLAQALRDALDDVDLGGVGLPALRRIFPELGLCSPGEPEDLAALEATVELIRRHAPLVLILDDIHRADPSTLAAVSYLQRRCHDLPVVLVAAMRSGEIAPDHSLRRLPTDRTIRLEPLNAAELSPLGIVDLHERTDGHPALVAGLVGNGAAPDLRQTLSELLMARCRSEGIESYRILRAAATLEQPFDPEILATLVGTDPVDLIEQLERLCDCRLLRTDGVRFRYRYGILRDILAASVSPARRRLLDERAGVGRARVAALSDGALLRPVSGL